MTKENEGKGSIKRTKFGLKKDIVCMGIFKI